MGLWNWVTGLFDHGSIADISPPPHTDINPATGLPMVGGIGGIDVAGNPFGHDLHRWQSMDPNGLDRHGGSSGQIGGCGSGWGDTWLHGTCFDWDH